MRAIIQKMKKLMLVFAASLLYVAVYAQTAPAAKPAVKPKPVLPPPLALREVSGIVIDSTEDAVIGAVVKLIIQKDTLRTVTDTRGVFVFSNVSSSIFALSVKGLSYAVFNEKYKFNDLKKYLVLDPLILRSAYRTLKEVKIVGTIGVVYKTDTAEYTASDYKVRENATMDELLKKMPGVEVSSAGKVTYQGQEVQKAKVNGKTFAGGNVAQAVQNLPANIADKVQFVNDYGDQAERTGIKDGDPQLILNVTTRADKSIGNIATITAGGGNDDRYNEKLFLQRINANQQFTVIGNIQNTLNGVASGSGPGAGVGTISSGSAASGGNTVSGRPTIAYRDQWGKHIQVNTSYTFNFSDVNLIDNSNGQYFSSMGTTNFVKNSVSQNNSTAHNFSFEMDITPDSADFLRISPNFSYSGSNLSGNSQQTLMGYQNEGQTGFTGSKSTSPIFGGTFLYQRLFKKPHRNFSVQFTINSNDQQQTNETNKHIAYRDTLQVLLKDSLQHFIVSRSNLANTYTGGITYTEPLTLVSQLSFSAQSSTRTYNNTALTDSINKAGTVFEAPSLSNIYQYSFTETRLAVNYSINKVKYRVSLGFTAIPTLLQGNKESLNATTYQTDFHLIPLVRLQYNWSKTQSITLNYSGSSIEPTFTELQPVTDKSDPQNVIVGNPDLKPSFRNSINLQYNNYLPAAKLTLGAGGNVSFINNQVIVNTIQVPIPSLSSFYNETHFLNMNGTYSVNGNYVFSKQISDQKYNFNLNGNVSYVRNLTMSNSIVYPATTWRFSERLGPQINPNDNVEINPNISYDISRAFFTQPNALNTNTRITSLNIDGRFFWKERWRLGYSANKNFVQGISYNTTKNPFVVNGYVERQFFKKKNGVLRLQMFDILNQNNFVNQVVTTSSITNNNTNTQSRYLFLSFVLYLQKWSGTPKRNGATMQRRGDGSFIY